MDETLIHTLTDEEEHIKPDVVLKMQIPNDCGIFTVKSSLIIINLPLGKNLHPSKHIIDSEGTEKVTL